MNKNAKPKATLIHEWDHGKDRYRLIAVADHTPGFEDHIKIEKLGQDGLGEPRWDHIDGWRVRDNDRSTAHLLVAAVKSLLADQRR